MNPIKNRGVAEMGMEAIYEFEVKDMPVAVAVDSQGENIHAVFNNLCKSL
jgi:fumarate hydratase class I